MYYSLLFFCKEIIFVALFEAINEDPSHRHRAMNTNHRHYLNGTLNCRMYTFTYIHIPAYHEGNSYLYCLYI